MNDIEALLVFELCPGMAILKKFIRFKIGGTLFNLIEQRSKMGQEGLDEIEILEILGEVANGIIHLHMQDPPIAHRDLKLENVLKGSDGKWKLCDFGSSTNT